MRVCKILQASDRWLMRKLCKDLPTIFFGGILCSAGGWDILDAFTRSKTGPLGEIIMEWTAPAFEEVCLNCEINSYASAKL